MNWITTNIRLPEDIYMDLKMQAARERKSVAAIIRGKLANRKNENAHELIETMKNIGKTLARESKGLNLTKAIIEMRYEQ